MSALGQISLDRRAPQVVKPYRADVRLVKTRKATAAKSAYRRAPARYDYEERLRFARDIGYFRGLFDKHYEGRNFDTGAEWLSWLAGWRVGIAEFRAAAAAEKLREDRIDAEMRGELDEILSAESTMRTIPDGSEVLEN